MSSKSIQNGIKRQVVNLLAFPFVAKGFSAVAARHWVRHRHYSYMDALQGKRYSLGQVHWAIKHGFLPQQVEHLDITKENYRDYITPLDYAYLQPLDGIYQKWVRDIVTVHNVFKPFRDAMPQCYYHLYHRDGSLKIIPLLDINGGRHMDDVIKLLKEKESLAVKDAVHHTGVTMAYRDNNFSLDGKQISRNDLESYLESRDGFTVITDTVDFAKAFIGAKLNLIAFNEFGDNPVVGDAYITFSDYNGFAPIRLEDESRKSEKTTPVLFYCVDKQTGELRLADSCRGMKEINPITGAPIPSHIPGWSDIVSTVDKMCRFVPQLEFFGLSIVITEDGFKIVRLLSNPSYPDKVPFSKETSTYLRKKYADKEKFYNTSNILQRAWEKIRRRFSLVIRYIFLPKHINLNVWLKDQWKDIRTNKDTSWKEKIWAIRHGFLSYRLHQYNITPENWKNYISDLEYRWIRHINNDYRVWFEDKITIKYICSKFNHCFPAYYFHISLKDGKNKILPMMDCPEGLEGTYEDIFRLVEMKKSLALKPDKGSKGKGFFKFTFYDGKYYLNHKEASKQEVLDILQDASNQYLITEYIDMHPEIKKIYSGAVNTIRMIVFKKDGVTPQIGNAYMRFGSARTGAVDNMGAGGMYARIDVDTGRFYDAKIIEGNEIKPCLYHPDTNVRIEGYLPNWEKVKQQVIDVACELQQTEFFGFDVALTPDGLKFPEINRSPDYPAIETYTPATIDYLLYKLEMKKQLVNYDRKKDHAVFKLPDRS